MPGRRNRTAHVTAAPQPGAVSQSAGHSLLPALPVALVTMTSLLPTEAIGDDSLCLLVALWWLGASAWIYVRIRQQVSIHVTKTDGWWGVAAVFVIVGAWFTLGAGDSRRGMNATWTWSIYPIAFFMIRDVFRSPKARRAFTAWMMSLACGLAVYGVYQYFIGLPALRSYFEMLPPEAKEKLLAEIGVGADPSSPLHRQFLNRLESTEPFGTFALANSLAGFLACWSLLAVPVLSARIWGPRVCGATGSHARGRDTGAGSGSGASGRRKTPPQEPFGRLSTVVVAVGGAAVALCLVLTKSRSAWLALGAGGLLVSLWLRSPGLPKSRILLFLGRIAASLLVVGIAVGAVDQQVLTEARLSVAYRVQYWQSTCAMIADHPFFGVGAGHFQQYYAQYKLPEASEMISDPHQFFLEMWATLGIVPTFTVVGYVAYRLSALVARRDSQADELNADQPAEPDETYLPRRVMLGGVAGCFLAVLAGVPFETLDVLVGIPLPVIWGLVLPSSIIVYCSFSSWVSLGRWCDWWPLAAVGVLCLNLLAAGGIAFPAIAVTLWCLLAVGSPQPKKTGASFSTRGHAGLLGVVSLILLVHVFGQLQPVMQRRQAMSQALIARSSESERLFNQAVAADSRSPVPLQLLAELQLRRWREGPGSEAAFRDALDRWIESAAESHGSRLLAGKWSLVAHDKTKETAWRDRATIEFEHAARLYPNYAMSHAQLSWVYHLSNRPAEAKAEAVEALRLDKLHDHAEHKLGTRQVEFLHLPAWESVPQRRDSAEQTMDRLRIGSAD